jgi:hypothetical protein
VSPLQTPFVAQSFSPAWLAAHAYKIQLTATVLAALATRSLRAEVWHRCSRGAAAAAPGGRREVLLGWGAAPLLDVLRKPQVSPGGSSSLPALHAPATFPALLAMYARWDAGTPRLHVMRASWLLGSAQGLQCWVPLASASSSRGIGSEEASVGAVQVAVRFTHLGGLALPGDSVGCDTAAGRQLEPPLLQCAAAAALVPPPLRTALLLPPGAGFEGQRAVLVVRLGLLLPPTSSSGRPKADRFFCSYSLPGSSTTVTTAARVLAAVAGRTVPLSRSRGSSVQGGSSREQQPLWGAKLNHSAFAEASLLLEMPAVRALATLPSLPSKAGPFLSCAGGCWARPGCSAFACPAARGCLQAAGGSGEQRQRQLQCCIRGTRERSSWHAGRQDRTRSVGAAVAGQPQHS